MDNSVAKELKMVEYAHSAIMTGTEFSWGQFAKENNIDRPKSCWDKWGRQLNPLMKKCPWSPEEDQYLIIRRVHFQSRYFVGASYVATGDLANAAKTYRDLTLQTAESKNQQREISAHVK